MVKTISQIQVLDAEKRRVPSKHYVYVILVTWSDGSSLTVFRRYSRFFDLQTKLLDLFPIEGGRIDPEKRIIPCLPGKILFGRSAIKDVAMKRLKEINVYCKKLIELPAHLSACEEIIQFFEVEPEDLDPPKQADSGDSKKLLSLSSLSLNSLSKRRGGKEKKAEEISHPKQLEKFVCIAEYVPQAPGEIPLQPGVLVEVLEKSDSGWWFVNSEDEQGWAPSTYLEPESDNEYNVEVVDETETDSDNKHICIENFTASSPDEISLEKGVVVDVIKKSMDGWWLVRYQGREALAPGTYLKKASHPHSESIIQQARLSGVQIISSLHDVSPLLKKDEKPSQASPLTKQDSPSQQRKLLSSAVVKQRSLERGGSLKPPPRQNSIKKMPAALSEFKSNAYITIEDFEDTVGDGISFKKGEIVIVQEKTPSGWWYVSLGQDEGWVPAAYLQLSDQPPIYDVSGPVNSSIQDDYSDRESDFDYDEHDYVVPDSPLGSNLSRNLSIPVDSKLPNSAKRPLPQIPKEEEQSEQNSSPHIKESSSTKPVKFAWRPLPQAPVGSDSRCTTPGVSDTSSGLPSGKPSNPGDKTSESRVAGPVDLASVLKSKFAARSQASNSSDDELDRNSSRESSPKPQISKLGASKGFSKPLPPQKNKPSPSDKPKPPIDKPKPPIDKPKPPVFSKKPGPPSLPQKPPTTVKNISPALPLKPVKKQISNVTNDKQISNATNDEPLSERTNVKAMLGLFNQTAEPKPGQQVKPKLPSKPKPGLAIKPAVTTKPAGQLPINSLINQLNSNLNLNKTPVAAVDINQNKTKLSEPDGVEERSGFSSQTQMCKALFDFTAENDGEMSLCEGDEMELVEDAGDWYLVRLYEEEGWAPASYLEKI